MGKARRVLSITGVAVQIMAVVASSTLLYTNVVAADDPPTTTISGTVTGPGGEQIGENVVIDITTPGDSSDVLYETNAGGLGGYGFGAPTAGKYEATVPIGTYDVVIYSSNSSLWQTVTYSNVVADHPINFDTDLVPTGSSSHLTGKVTTASGQPVADAWLQLGCAGVSMYTKTDEQGNYGFIAPNSSDANDYYVMDVMGDDVAGNTSLGLPQHFTYRSTAAITLNADMTKDFQLPPTTTVHVSLTDRTGAPAAGQNITFNDLGIPTSDQSVLMNEQDDAVTSTDGTAQFIAWDGATYHVESNYTRWLYVSFTDNTELKTQLAGVDLTNDPSVSLSQNQATANDLAAPTNTAATVNSDGTVSLSWTPSNPDSVSGYVVYRDGISIDNNVVWGSDGASWTDPSPLSGSHTYYVVAFRRHAGNSCYSPIVTVTTP